IYVEEMKDLVLEKPGRPDYLFGVKATTLVISLGKSLKEVSEKLGLPVTTSHGFRHAVGYHFLRAGCDIRFIQEILGHEHITSTEIYTKVDKKDLKKVLDKYHPRNWKKSHEEAEL
ncbi:MAG: tyrosine-type recombinase/integrase, partial [Clostridia bacterium]|nr:tyrosine-type recombinase/integrase [Clostridia bacterium]